MLLFINFILCFEFVHVYSLILFLYLQQNLLSLNYLLLSLLYLFLYSFLELRNLIFYQQQYFHLANLKIVIYDFLILLFPLLLNTYQNKLLLLVLILFDLLHLFLIILLFLDYLNHELTMNGTYRHIKIIRFNMLIMISLI